MCKKLTYKELEQVSDANYAAWKNAESGLEFANMLARMVDDTLDAAGVEMDNDECERIQSLIDERDQLRELVIEIKKSIDFCYSDQNLAARLVNRLIEKSEVVIDWGEAVDN